MLEKVVEREMDLCWIFGDAVDITNCSVMPLPRSSKNAPPSPPQQKPPRLPPPIAALDDKDLEKLESYISDVFGWPHKLRECQIDAIRVQLQKRDVIVHAGTGMGKTEIAAGPHAHPLRKGRTTIFISPLIALQNK